MWGGICDTMFTIMDKVAHLAFVALIASLLNVFVGRCHTLAALAKNTFTDMGSTNSADGYSTALAVANCRRTWMMFALQGKVLEKIWLIFVMRKTITETST